MEKSQLLLEYLKEQYTQARQHETRQTAATTFLTTASGAILGLSMSGGKIMHDQWWLGLVVAGLGFANLLILSAHHIGNRFHTSLAGKVRRRLEEICDGDSGLTTADLRQQALEDMKLSGPDVSIGAIVYKRLRLIPWLIVVAGLLVAILAICLGS